MLSSRNLSNEKEIPFTERVGELSDGAAKISSLLKGDVFDRIGAFSVDEILQLRMRRAGQSLLGSVVDAGNAKSEELKCRCG